MAGVPAKVILRVEADDGIRYSKCGEFLKLRYGLIADVEAISRHLM